MTKLFKEKGIEKAHVTLEATNIYWHDVTKYLYKKQNVIVSVINPLQTAAYAKCRMQRGKTGKMDTLLLARYGKNEQPAPWKPLNKASSHGSSARTFEELVNKSSKRNYRRRTN